MRVNLKPGDNRDSPRRRLLKRSSVRNALAAIVMTGSCAAALPTAAQASVGSYNLPDHYTFDKLGINVGPFLYERRDTFLTIGDPSNGGLSWAFAGHQNSDPYEGTVALWGPPVLGGYEYQVKIGGHMTQFINCDQGSCQNWQGTPSTLVDNGTNWVFTAEDGTFYTFDKSGSGGGSSTNQPGMLLGKLLSIKRPSGDLITINYPPGSSVSYVIQSVVSSRGYALKYESGKISAVNLANHTCDATISTCDGVDSSITLSALNVVGGDGITYDATQITDPAGGNWQYTVYEVPKWLNPDDPPNEDGPINDGIRYFKSPQGYEVTLDYDPAGRLTKFIDNRGTWNYTYDQDLWMAEHGVAHGVFHVTDPSGNAFYDGSFANGEASYIEDPLGNKTTPGLDYHSYYAGPGYLDYSRPLSLIQPEGNSRTLSYDARGNVSAVTEAAKTGSALPAITITAAYPATCTNSLTCNKPTSTTDANGNVTDYVYDPAHGGVLTVMEPATSSGAARPLKLTTWVQKTPYYKNPSGTLVASSTPIWVVSTETECQTVAGSSAPFCDSAANKSVATYQYGANGTANSLWPHGVAVVADGITRRTCFTYDNLGRKVSETKPNANLSVCP